MSLGVAAACKTVLSGFDSHQCHFEGMHCCRVQRRLGHSVEFGLNCSEHGF